MSIVTSYYHLHDTIHLQPLYYSPITSYRVSSILVVTVAAMIRSDNHNNTIIALIYGLIVQ